MRQENGRVFHCFNEINEKNPLQVYHTRCRLSDKRWQGPEKTLKILRLKYVLFFAQKIPYDVEQSVLSQLQEETDSSFFHW